jgi:hypothetical protein
MEGYAHLFFGGIVMSQKDKVIKKRDVCMQLRFATDEHLLTTSAAQYCGLSFSAWARLVLCERAREELAQKLALEELVAAAAG